MPSRPDPAPATPPADPPRGIRCRNCHCADLRVVQTIRSDADRIYRRRVCRNCGTALMTTEASNGAK
jgi:ribosomal protein L40E